MHKITWQTFYGTKLGMNKMNEWIKFFKTGHKYPINSINLFRIDGVHLKITCSCKPVIIFIEQTYI